MTHVPTHTHYDSETKGRIEIKTMFGEHAYNTADKLEREGKDPTLVLDIREHAHDAYTKWAEENPDKAAEAAAKRAAKGLAPRGRAS